MTDKKTVKKFTLAEAEVIGNKLGIEWQAYDAKQFQGGLNAELKDGATNPVTHFPTTDPIVLGKIVRANLKRASNYYTKWAQNEKDAKRKHATKKRKTKSKESDKES